MFAIEKEKKLSTNNCNMEQQPAVSQPKWKSMYTKVNARKKEYGCTYKSMGEGYKINSKGSSSWSMDAITEQV